MFCFWEGILAGRIMEVKFAEGNTAAEESQVIKVVVFVESI